MHARFVGGVTHGVETGEPQLELQFAQGGYRAELKLEANEVLNILNTCLSFLRNHYPQLAPKPEDPA